MTKRTWKGLLNNKKSITDLLTLPTFNTQTILVRNKNRDFICGIYWDTDESKWRFWFHGFMSYLYDDEHLLRLFEMNNEELTATLLQNKAQLMSEIKRYSYTCCIDSCLSRTGNLPDLITDTKSDLGKPVYFNDNTNDCGVLVGLSSTLEDYYYIVMFSDKSICRYSCVCGYKVMTQENIPQELKEFINNPDIDSFIMEMRNTIFNENSEEIEILIY